MSPRLHQMHDPFALPDMDRAVTRIVRAVTKQERICVVGDYDTDGATGTALAFRFFQAIGSPVRWFLPRRVGEGYGLTVAALGRLLAEQ
ncbi:MAG: single-stranded-DNA-specific exonuclease RecJ, partial [Deltaproteobacteria bacterium]|nr:single-stranded-DNA-specific exonuclease RecJ [Deltaproteobacteria bacterium]